MDGQAIEVEDLCVRYGERTVIEGLSFTIPAGELVTLLGPSGCGKTTTLRVLAGLETPSGGEVRIGSKIVFSSRRGIDVPTEKRDLSMVFQSYAIWPHMTVAENTAYGLRTRAVPAAERQRRTLETLELVQMADRAGHSAAKLSGGQQQRVALARALVVSPSVLLLDEPLSNLDAKLRLRMRLEIQALQKRLGCTAVYVTHDQEEALVISDRVIVMHGGRIAQSGPPAEIYDRPRDAFVADFVGGANLLEGVVTGEEPERLTIRTQGGLSVTAARHGRPAGASATIAIRPAHVAMLPAGAAVAANTWPARIRQRAFMGDVIEYLLDGADGDFVARRPANELYHVGESVLLSAAPDRCVLLHS